MNSLADRVAEVRQRIAQAMERRGPGPEVTLIAVSKRHSAETIRSAFEAGLTEFGENYAQELTEKHSVLQGLALKWHFVGSLQSNKVQAVLNCRARIHSVDRASLLAEIERRTPLGSLTEVLLEINFDESQKAGVRESELEPLLGQFATLERVRCCGLMAIPPAGSPETTRGYFRRLRQLRDLIGTAPNVAPVHLSMGMSQDFEIAIEEGATMVRVGTTLFGDRPAPARGKE